MLGAMRQEEEESGNGREDASSGAVDQEKIQEPMSKHGRGCVKKETCSARKTRGTCMHQLNTLQKLKSREMGLASRGCSVAANAITSASTTAHSSAQEIFDEIHCPQEVLDVFGDQKAIDFLEPKFLKDRTPVSNIVAAQDLVIAVTVTGLAITFCRVTNRPVAVLNQIPDEVIQTVFFNQLNDSVITVSTYRSDDYTSRRCKSIKTEYIRRNQVNLGFDIFETENVSWPGYVGFDEVNEKVVIVSKKECEYKVFDLKDYTFLYSVRETNLDDIQCSSGSMLLKFGSSSNLLPLQIRNAENGAVMSSLNHVRNDKFDLVTYLNGKVLIKEQNRGLKLIDVQNNRKIEVQSASVKSPCTFQLLHRRNLFLTFQEMFSGIWNLQGNFVSVFENHILLAADCNIDNTCITMNDDMIISVCKGSGTISINMSCLGCGRCIQEICPSDRKLLSDVTTISCNKDLNEVYTGNEMGLIRIWSITKGKT